jgi:glycosyltransferase involved in cell wall biosynthesis
VRVAYLTPQYPKVSHTFIRREIAALEARGHEVVRMSIRTPDQELSVDPQDKAEASRTFSCLGQGPTALAAAVLVTVARRPAAAFAGLRLATRVARGAGVVRALAYFVEACLIQRHLRASDVSHLHVHFGTNAATVALLIAEMGGPGFSMTVHGPDEFDAPAAHMLAAKVAAARFAVGISDFTAAQLQRWSEAPHWEKIHVVRCTVDERFFAAASPIGPARQLVCVGRLCPQKGQLVLVEAFARLAAEDSGAQLVLAGDGEMRPDIERAIARHGLGGRIHLTGWIDERQVRQHILASRCFVLPSFAEGLPVSIMEAFALGRPVISTYVAGIPELVRPGENGWLVPAGNVDALFVAMREALSAPVERLQALADAGARAVRERHDSATEAARLEKLLQVASTES